VEAATASDAPAHIPTEPYPVPTDDELDDLWATLRTMLTAGFAAPDLDMWRGFGVPVSSLHVWLRGNPRVKPKYTESNEQGNRWLPQRDTARRAYRAPGAYVQRVEGALQHVVPYMLTHLLTLPNMVAVQQCGSPNCGNVIVNTPRAGAPRHYCPRCAAVRGHEQRNERKRKYRRRRR
jgi:hypothetical protein